MICIAIDVMKDISYSIHRFQSKRALCGPWSKPHEQLRKFGMYFPSEADLHTSLVDVALVDTELTDLK